MRYLNFDISLDLPKARAWEIITQYENFPKYFEYVHKSFHKGEMKKGSIWVDLATVVYFPTLAIHKVTEFEKEKKLQFYVPLPLIGGIKETMDFTGEGNKTFIKVAIDYEFGPIFGPLFNGIFAKRFTKMIQDGLDNFKKNPN